MQASREIATNNQLHGHIETSKNTVNSGPNFFSQKQNNPPRASKIRALWVQLCNAHEYKSLSQILASAKEKGFSIEDFFSQEGRFIINWAIVIQPDYKSFQFICTIVPHNLIIDTLSRDNFSTLKIFLIGESGLDRSHKTDTKAMKSRIEKFKLLLNLDTTAKGKLKVFIEQNIAEESISEDVRTNFNEALHQCANQNQLLTIVGKQNSAPH